MKDKNMDKNRPIAWMVIDTEAVPNGDLIKAAKYPGQSITAEEAIDKAMTEAKAASDKGSDFINVAFQKPVCIAAASLDEDLRIVKMNGGVFLNEATAAEQFWTRVGQTYEKYRPIKKANDDPKEEKQELEPNPFWGTRFVTYNGRGFDMPLMELAGFRHGIAAPSAYNNDKYGFRYRYGDKHIDLHEFVTNFGAARLCGGLDMLAKSIGAPGKSGTCGSDVLRLWRSGEHALINAYCQRDVLDTYLVFLRTRVIVGQINLKDESTLRDELVEYLKKEGVARPHLLDYLRDWRGEA